MAAADRPPYRRPDAVGRSRGNLPATRRGALLARTRAELELTGQHPRRDWAPARDTAAILTAQELRVARLAAQGLTNREIGAQLLISPRTVGHHLTNVFPKLGIVSRADLTRIDFEDGLRLMG